MSGVRIAAAQSVSQAADLLANLTTHCRFIETASAADVDILVFPELSLSGYEPKYVKDLALGPTDKRLDPIRELLCSRSMTVVVGAPVSSDADKPYIGAICFFPDGRSVVYRKQYLHPGEEAFSLAICADITHEAHARVAADSGASMYLAGVFITPGGYEVDASLVRGYAESHGFAVLMANHGGPSGGISSAGKSAIWAPGGNLLAAAPEAGNWLVIAAKKTEGWSGEVLALDESLVV